LKRFASFLAITLLVFSCIVTGTSYGVEISEVSEVICPECGEKNSEDGLFCAGCGTKLITSDVGDLSKSGKKKSLNFTNPVLNTREPNPQIIKPAADPVGVSVDPREVISNMSRQDLLRLIELLIDRQDNYPHQFDQNLVGSMTKDELEEFLRVPLQTHIKKEENIWGNNFFQVVGKLACIFFFILILA